MKRSIVANCEKTFIRKAVAESVRLDGRSLDEFRKCKINFGSTWGTVHVALGETRALAQVTCDVVEPRNARPNEGRLYFNLELGPMAAPLLEPGRPTKDIIQMDRILEKIFKESNCVDLESLCIVAAAKVWNLRVDINILNNEGNIMDCASIAALAALSHFKRPDVTVSGDEVIVNTLSEKDPLPLVLHHFPVSVSYAIFNDGKQAVADPTALEERISNTSMILGLNSYKELCVLNVSGASQDLLLRTCSLAAAQAKSTVEFIKLRIAEDAEVRATGKKVGFTECVRTNKISANVQANPKIKLKKFKPIVPYKDDIEIEFDTIDISDKEMVKTEDTSTRILALGDKSGILLSNEDPTNERAPQWVPEEEILDDDDDDESEAEEMEVVESKVAAKKSKSKRKKSNKSQKMQDIDDDSEEEEKATLLLS